MKAQQIMTTSLACVSPSDSVHLAAELMTEYDCGVFRSLGRGQAIGVITDRDIAVRVVGRGRAPATAVAEVMSHNVECCTSDRDVREIERVMGGRQIRRVVLVDDAACLVRW